jgi:hypothetical protein
MDNLDFVRTPLFESDLARRSNSRLNQHHQDRLGLAQTEQFDNINTSITNMTNSRYQQEEHKSHHFSEMNYSRSEVQVNTNEKVYRERVSLWEKQQHNPTISDDIIEPLDYNYIDQKRPTSPKIEQEPKSDKHQHLIDIVTDVLTHIPSDNEQKQINILKEKEKEKSLINLTDIARDVRELGNERHSSSTSNKESEHYDHYNRYRNADKIDPNQSTLTKSNLVDIVSQVHKEAENENKKVVDDINQHKTSTQIKPIIKPTPVDPFPNLANIVEDIYEINQNNDKNTNEMNSFFDNTIINNEQLLKESLSKAVDLAQVIGDDKNIGIVKVSLDFDKNKNCLLVVVHEAK